MEPVPINRFKSGTGSINRFQKKTGLPALLLFLHVFSFISNEYDKIKCFKKSVVGYIFGWKPEYFSCLGYPIRTHSHTRGNSVAHVCLLSKPIYLTYK
jgi:hypothetical protein